MWCESIVLWSQWMKSRHLDLLLSFSSPFVCQFCFCFCFYFSKSKATNFSLYLSLSARRLSDGSLTLKYFPLSLSLPPRWHEKKELEDKKIIFVCVCWISVMGAESSTAMNSDGNNKNVETQVVLNVYDLTPINNYMVWFGFGIFHSGIEGW